MLQTLPSVPAVPATETDSPVPSTLLSTYAISSYGELMLPHSSSPLLERWIPTAPLTRQLVLNRPSRLHALTADMCRMLYARMRRLEASTRTQLVVLSAAGTARRAFCAGGDVRSIHALGDQGKWEGVDQLFRWELPMNSFMARMRTPVVALMDGVVMGGGAGLAMHGRFRVATEATVFAMPECSIGLFPDVGASFFLSRLEPKGLGMYIALTGARLKGRQVKDVGLATHFVASADIAALSERLQTAKVSKWDDASVAVVLREFEATEGTAEPIEGLPVIERCFRESSVEEIVSKLQTLAEGGPTESRPFAMRTVQMIRKGCPTSVKIAFEAQRRGVKLSLDECLKMEFRLLARCIRRQDFYAGVKSALITKDKKPVWDPPTLEAVLPESVEQHFAMLHTDLQIAELDLSHASSEGQINAKGKPRL